MQSYKHWLSTPSGILRKKMKQLRESCGKVAEKLRDLLSEFCSLFNSWTHDIGQNLSYQFDMSENWTKKVQTSLLFLNQIANFIKVNSEKTISSYQVTKIYFKLGKVAGKLRKDAESCKKMRKVAKRCGKLRNCENSKSCNFRNFRNRAKFQRVCYVYLW